MSGLCRICGGEHAEIECPRSAGMLRDHAQIANWWYLGRDCPVPAAIADQIDALLAEGGTRP